MWSTSFREWLDEKIDAGWGVWFKRLSANDTGLTGSHQVGFYVPKEVLHTAFASLAERSERGEQNPSIELHGLIFPGGEHRDLRCVYYNSRKIGTGTRDEARITRWRGILHPDMTGGLIVIAVAPLGRPNCLEIWVVTSEAEEVLVEERFGPAEPESRPGAVLLPGAPGLIDVVREDVKRLVPEPEALPESWLTQDCETFHVSGQDIVRHVVGLIPPAAAPDTRLLRRRKMEFAVYRAVEDALCLDIVRRGFDSIDGFIAMGLRLTNRRKARSGRSLELHMKEIFDEEGISYEWNPVLEDGSRPDFIFPSLDAWCDPQWPHDKLRMLACKTTCKDRWRQILREARGRILRRHLLTLQEGVSESQLEEMQESAVTLVVPRALHKKYPKSRQGELWTVARFLQDVRKLTR